MWLKIKLVLNVLKKWLDLGSLLDIFCLTGPRGGVLVGSMCWGARAWDSNSGYLWIKKLSSRTSVENLVYSLGAQFAAFWWILRAETADGK